METEKRPDGWTVTYPNKEWCVYEKRRIGGSEAEWGADKDGVSCALRCNGYGSYSDSSELPWSLLIELAATQGYELKKREPCVVNIESSKPTTSEETIPTNAS